MTETKIDRGFFNICEAYQNMLNRRSMICENWDFDEYQNRLDQSNEELENYGKPNMVSRMGYAKKKIANMEDECSRQNQQNQNESVMEEQDGFEQEDEENPSEEERNYRYMSDDTIHDQYSGWWFSWIEKEDGDRGISITAEINFPSANGVDFDSSTVLWYLYPKTQVGRHRQYESPVKNPTEMNGIWLPDDVKGEVLDVIDHIYDTFYEGQTMEFDDKNEFDEWKTTVPSVGESCFGNYEYSNMCESFDQPEYKRYVVINGKIESGWDYTEDAKDRKNELEEDGIPSKILSRQFLIRNGIDPSDDGNWITGNVRNYA